MSAQIRAQVLEAAAVWAAAFNRGDARACAACYTENASLRADPLANVEGREAIQAFWAGLIADGFSDVRYLAPEIEVVDADTATLASPWAMNKAHGVIHKETWRRCSDGRWRLAADHFEVVG